MIRSRVTKFKAFAFLFSLIAGSFAAGMPAAAQTIDSYILIQPIQVCDDSGNNCAQLVTFPEETKKIYAQAGIFPVLLPANQLNDTSLQSVSGIGAIDGSGGMSADPLTLNVWFVLDLPTGDPNTVLYGEAWIDANGVVVNSTDVANFNGGNGRRDTFAHEIGHNLNLGHNSFGAGGANNLMTAGSSRSVPNGVGNITPDGLALSVLTQDQIDEIRDNSQFVQTASDCLGDGGNNVITKTFSEVCLNLRGLGGNDVLTLTGGVVLGDLTGDGGDDIITLGDGSTVLGNVDGGSGNDNITLNANADPVDIFGGTGNDNITLNAGSLVTGSVYGDDDDGNEGDDGSDLIVMNGGTVNGDVDGEGGDDVIRILGGQVDGGVFGGGGNDVIETDEPATVDGNVDGQAGDDTITIASDPADVLGGTGDDVINILSGAVIANVYGDDNDGDENNDGDDTIAMNGGTVNGDVDGEGGDDVIRILGGQVDGGVFGGGGNDVIETDEPATVDGNVDGQAGDDTITIASDPADVLGGVGDDVINILSGAVIANVYGDDNDGDENNDGDDTIVMNGGSVSGDIDGEGGDNLIRIFGGSVGGDVLGGNDIDTFELAGGTIGGNVGGANGNDTFVLTGTSVSGSLEGGNDDDSFTLSGGSVSDDVSGGNGEDSFILAGGTVGDEVSGGNNNDTFVLTGTTVNGDLNGGNGDDDFTLAGGSVGGDVEGGNNSDTFLLTGSSISGDVSGGNHNDTFTLAGGSIGGDANGGNGNDTISLLSTTISGDIIGGNNNDVIVQTGGSVTNISGGFNNDVIQVLGGTVNGSIFGDEGDDVIATAEPGTVAGDVDGGEDNDTITIASDPTDVLGGTGDDTIDIVTGAVVTGSVYGDDNDGNEGNDGNDTINLTGGSVAGDVFGEGGGDDITLAGTIVGGDLSGDGGADSLLITGGSVTNVFGGAGNDAAVWTGGVIATSVGMGAGTDTLDIYGVNTGGTALQAGLTVLDGGDDASSADGEIDTLNLRGVVEVLTDLQNWEFINLVDTSIGDLGQASRAIVTEQFFVEAGSALVATGDFGSTQSYVIDGDLWNDGFLDMRDGAPSYDELETTGTYTGGPGSVLRTDTFLGGVGSPSDLMIVGTATVGETALFVFDTNPGPGAYNPDGIPIVDVSTGTTSEDHFLLVNGFTGLAGPIDKGLFFYDLALRPDNVHVLIGVPDLEAFQLGRISTQAQSAWHTSTGVWLDRTADLRAHLDGSAAPAGTRGAISPGFWIKGVGGFLDREDETTITLFNKSYTYNTSYDQNTYGALAGGDWAWGGQDGAGALGVFAGYVGWDARFEQQSANGAYSKLEASGLTVGAYATYLNKGFFLDGVFKADLPDIDLSFPGLEPVGPSTDTVDARALGGVLDTGYRHNFNYKWYIEGLGTLAYVDTDIDAAELGGSVIDFGSDQSFRGRLGMGFGGTFAMGEVATAISRLSVSAWHEFDGDNGTDILSPGGAPLDIRDDFGGTYGEVSALINIFGNESDLSFFLKTDYRFGGDTSEFAGSLGLRYTP